MTTYSTIITNNGKAMFASAATSSGRVNITHLAVGDGNGSVPTPKAIQTRLIKEAHRVTVNSVERHATNANWIEIGAIIPSSSGGYTVREIGLYAGNTLIAVGSFPATYKPTASEGGAREMSIRIIIAVENAAVVNVTLDNSLVYATRQWVESNFVNHNEVIDNLTSIDADKPLSANQGKVLKDGLDGLTTSKADKTTNLTAGNGLTGGGNLSASRTVALGTPGQITATSTNGVTATSHTHAIDKASTTVAGVVQLNDTLASTATDQALTAAQGKVLKDGLDGLTTSKADKTTNLTAGNGLTGGGNLSASRTVALGTPSQITAGTTNSVTTTSHTHAIDKASTTVAGVVQLNDTLTSTATNQALTANQGKVLNDKIDNKDSLKTINYLDDKSSNYQLTGFYRGNSQPLDGINTSSLEIHITHPAFPANAHARGIGFDYGSAGFGVYTHAWDSSGVHLGRKIILTEENGVMKSGDTMTGVLGITRNAWEKMRFTNNDGSYWRFEAAPVRSGENGARFNWVFTGNDGTEVGRISFPRVSTGETIAYQSWVQSTNVASATRLQTARTINLTGAVTGSVSFDGSANVSIATTLQQGLGVGQSWQDVSASRSSSVTYTNSTGRPIFVRAFVTGGNKNLIGYVNGMIVDRHRDTYNSGVPEISIGFIVPNGATYRIDYTHADTVILELR